MNRQEFAAKIQARLRTQDNRITAHPIFIVQQRERIWGLDPDYTDSFVWIDRDGDEVDLALTASLEAGRQALASEVPGFRRVGYQDTWGFVQAFLTEAGAEEYIRRNGHNLSEPRIYAASGYRNQEWIDLRAYFLEEGL